MSDDSTNKEAKSTDEVTEIIEQFIKKGYVMLETSKGFQLQNQETGKIININLEQERKTKPFN